MSAGRISAASTSPERTLAIASASVFTRTTVIASKSGFASCATFTLSPPSETRFFSFGTWLRSATRGLLGPLVTAKPTSAAIRIGYSTSIATSRGERRRICRSLISSQRISVAFLPQERDEGRFEVERRALVALDRPLELARRPHEEKLAVRDHADLVRVPVGLLHVVGRVDDCRAAAGQLEDELPQLLALARIERGARLVQQEHVRLREQPDRDVHPLPVAAGERRDLVAGAVAQTGLLEHAVDHGLRIRALLEPREEPQVLRHRQLPVERGLLWDPPDLGRRLRDRALVRVLDAREDRQQRRLARAVRSDHRHQLAGRRRQRHAAQRLALAEALDEAARLEHGIARAARLGGRWSGLRHGARRYPAAPP